VEAQPDFNLYLMWIFSRLPDADPAARMAAGLTLKNHVTRHPERVTPAQLAFLRQELPRILADPVPSVRRTAAYTISTLVKVGSLAVWPQLLQYILGVLDRNAEAAAMNLNLPNFAELDGVFDALDMLSEDHTFELDNEIIGRPVNSILPIVQLPLV
jgi:hypothetical protein